MQLSLSHPVSFSVNLSESQAGLVNGVSQQTPILVSGAGKAVGPGVTVTSMAGLGKLVSNGPNGQQAVLVQGGQGGLLLPGQPAQPRVTVRQAAGQVMAVRQQSPVLVQLPSGQQLVRQVSLNPGQVSLVQQGGPGPAAAKAVVAAAPATPGSPAIPSPQPPQHAPDSPMVVLNHQPDAHPHFLLASGQKTAGLVAPGQLGPGQIMSGTINQAGVMATNTPHLKIRQQRKQSLK